MLVVSETRILYMNCCPDWTKNVISQTTYAQNIRTKFARFWTISWPIINIFNDETNFI